MFIHDTMNTGLISSFILNKNSDTDTDSVSIQERQP